MVGIGIYVRSAQALFLGGSIAIILSYLWVGSVAYTIAVTLEARNANLKVSIGEMTSVLPISGALFMLPSRTLSPAIVLHSDAKLINRVLLVDGHSGLGVIFVDVCLFFSCVMIAPNEAVTMLEIT